MDESWPPGEEQGELGGWQECHSHTLTETTGAERGVPDPAPPPAMSFFNSVPVSLGLPLAFLSPLTLSSLNHFLAHGVSSIKYRIT